MLTRQVWPASRARYVPLLNRSRRHLLGHWEAAGGALGAIAVGVVFGAAGLVMALDFRGFTSWHVRTTIRLSSPMASIPPWRWLPERVKSSDARFRRFYRLERILGWTFAGVGAIALATGLAATIAAAL